MTFYSVNNQVGLDLPPGEISNYSKSFEHLLKGKNFHLVADVDIDVAAELVDTGVNMGTQVAGKFLQQSLNVLNDGGVKYRDVIVDGKVGPKTIASLGLTD